MTDAGMMLLLEALPRQSSLLELTLSWELSPPDELLKKTGECIEKCALKQLTFYFYSPSFLSEEAVKAWVQRVIVGGKCLVRILECSQVLTLGMNIFFDDMSFAIDENGTQAHTTFINSRDSSCCQFGKRKEISTFPRI